MRASRASLGLTLVVTIVALAGTLGDIYKVRDAVLVALASCAAALAVTTAFLEYRRRGEEAPQPRLRLDTFEVSDATALHFRAQRAPLVGRVEELDKLREFVSGAERFRWWVITGAAGVGKSRLALEFCRGLGQKWNTGFLPLNEPFTAWDAWEPAKPTVIVVDYASTRAPWIGAAIATLAVRGTKLHRPVRILLLERRVEQHWFRKVLGAGGDALAAESTLHGPPLEVGSLPPDALWATMDAVVPSDDAGPEDRRDEILDALAEIDPLGRPLFALMAADALAEGKDIREWDQHSVLRYVIDRNDRFFWQPAGVTERDKNLLAFATMLVGGIEVSALRELQRLDPFGVFPDVEPSSPDRFNAERYAVLTGQDSRTSLAPLEPDLVGEFFFLEHMRPRDAADAERALAVELVAWLTSPEAAFDFTSRTLSDWPDHPALPTLTQLVNHTGGALLLELSSDEQRNEIAMFLGGAAGNVVHRHAVSGRIEAAAAAWEDLLEFTEASPDLTMSTIPLASVAIIVEAMLKGGASDEARKLLDRAGVFWQARERDPEDLEVLLRSLMLRASYDADTGELGTAARVLDETTAFALRLDAAPTASAWVAETASQLITAALDSRAYDVADAAFDDLVRLPGPEASPRFAEARAIGAFQLLMSYADRGTEDPQSVARVELIYGVGRDAAFSQSFAHAFGDDEDDVREHFHAVFRLLDETFAGGTDASTT